ncbi:MAG: Calx-beta domain-containing protein, partial [Cyanobacteriota bacterium]|nr:Calx-beta domain-containing protein [Cyanobacteriota bacterium]
MLNFNDYAIASYGGSQDKNPTVNIQSDGTTLEIIGNGWKKVALPYTITADTILEFDFKSTTPGEIHGIGFDSDNEISNNRTFQLYGSQSWGIDNFQDYATSAGDWKHYRIEVGQFYTGEMSHLTFTNDHDVSNPTAESLFANVRVYEDLPTITLGSLEFDSSTYSVNEDGTASISIRRFGGSHGAVSAEISLTGGTATAGTDVSNIFPISVNFADGESGSKTVTIPIVDDEIVEATETLHLTLGNVIGDVTIGTNATTVVSIQDNDTPSSTTTVLDFNDYAIASYGGSQDKNPTVNIQSDGTTLEIIGNGWKKVALPYTITADTILEFDFKSTTPGEIHGIGFDSDNEISNNRTFQLYGSQSWGIDDFRTYATSAGDWKHYRIEVGQFYTGEMSHLTFTNDHDISNPTAESLFANVRVYENLPTISSGTIEFDSSTYSINENGTEANITVTRTGGSDGAVSAEVSLTGGTATAGADFGNIFPISVN